MVALTHDYNPAEHDSFQEGFALIEEKGPFQVQIVEDKEEYTKDGAASMSALTIEIIDGEYKGRKVWERILVEADEVRATDKTKKGVKMGLQKLRDFCMAVGHTDLLRNTEELMFRPFLAELEIEGEKVENGKTYRAKNKLGKIYPLGGAVPPAEKPAVQQAARAASTPAAGKLSSVPNTSGVVRPWPRPGAPAGATAA